MSLRFSYWISWLFVVAFFFLNSFPVRIVAQEDDSVEMFFKLFVAKRMEQLQAVKNILNLDMERQKGFLDKITLKIQEVMTRHRVSMETSGYIPGAPGPGPAHHLGEDGEESSVLPADPAIRESLSLVLENSCLLCDIVLRLPDEMHKRFKANKDLDLILKWSVGFVKQIPLLDESTQRLLNLCSQEIGVIPKEAEYHNPYKIVKPAQKRFEDPPPPTKKPRLKLQRGPKMSRPEL